MTAQADHLLRDVDPAALPGGAAARAERDAARARFAAVGLPNRRVEAWHYTDLSRAIDAEFAPAPDRTEGLVERLPVGVPDLAIPRAALVNGRARADLSRLDGLPEGIRIVTLAEHLAAGGSLHLHEPAPTGGQDALPLAALNAAAAADGWVVQVAAGAGEAALHLVSIGVAGSSPGHFHPRVLVDLAEGARLRLFETHVGLPGMVYLANIVLEARLAADSSLVHFRLQAEDEDALHVATALVELGPRATYDALAVTAGARLSRHEPRVLMRGEGGSATLRVLYLGRGEQVLDTTSFVDHAVANASSRQTIKGVLDQSSRGVFQGRVLVRREAQRTDAGQLHKALLLSRAAEVDTKPGLEIYADDVQCSHGAAIGELEPDQIFYLRSRGLDEDAARDLLIEGFLGEVLEDCDWAMGREALAAVIRAWLAQRRARDGETSR